MRIMVSGFSTPAFSPFVSHAYTVDNDTGLYVYRTQPAIARSTRPNPPGHRRPRGAIYGESLNSDIDMESHTGPLPRGHLSFYRQIIPPTDCIAFRARLDNEGTAQERAVLGTAGTEAVYIWDLDDPSRVEKIPIAETDRQRIQVRRLRDGGVFTTLTRSTSSLTRITSSSARPSLCGYTRGARRGNSSPSLPRNVKC